MVRKSKRDQLLTSNYIVNEEFMDEMIKESETYHDPYPKLLPSEKAQLESDHETSFFTVEKILDKKKEGRKTLYFVKWEGYDIDQATWEPLSNLQNVKELVKEYDRQCELNNMGNQICSSSTMISNQPILGSMCANDIDVNSLPIKVPKKLGRPPKNDDSWRPEKTIDSKIKMAPKINKQNDT